jgi:queuine tRNA-ribosyltransferase
MPKNQFSTTLLNTHAYNQARIVQVDTPHGSFTTPAFMPVGTRAVVNCMTSEDLVQAGSQIILGGNTYHMLCSPGMDLIKEAGGMHPFMGWDKPMLTDSGGFQVFSLSKDSKICRTDEVGAHFKHPVSGQVVHLTPESSINAQKIIGADIIMAFDQCTPDVADKVLVQQIMERTHRWLLESIETHQHNTHSAYGNQQALFGIIQGGIYQDLREQSAAFVVEQDLDGIAIGGATIGFDMEKTVEILQWSQAYLPVNKLRYTMGVGLSPQDLIDVVAQGVDIFDCVAPTRNARHGALYCGEIQEADGWLKFASDDDRGRILIKKSQYKNDFNPIMPDCTCYTCQNHTRAYLHYLFKENQLAYYNLACIHNIRVMHSVTERLKAVIALP